MKSATSSAVSISAKQYFETETEVASSLLATDYKEPQAVAYGINRAITTGGNCTAQNQRDEVRDLGEASGCIPAEPGMKQQTFVLQGSMIGRSDKNGPQGDGVNEDVSFTLNTIDRHAVVETEAQAIDVYNQSIDGDVAPTLTSAAGGTNTSGPKILSAGFKPRQGVAAKGLGYETEMSPTRSTDENFAAIVTEAKDELADWLS